MSRGGERSILKETGPYAADETHVELAGSTIEVVSRRHLSTFDRSVSPSFKVFSLHFLGYRMCNNSHVNYSPLSMKSKIGNLNDF